MLVGGGQPIETTHRECKDYSYDNGVEFELPQTADIGRIWCCTLHTLWLLPPPTSIEESLYTLLALSPLAITQLLRKQGWSSAEPARCASLPPRQLVTPL